MGLQFAELDEGGYEDWAPKMEALLIEADLDEVVFGDASPPVGSPNSKPVKAWEKKKRLAKAKITLYVAKSQLPHLRVSNDPRVIWAELKRVHRASGFGTLLAMRRRFFSMRAGPEQTMLSWIADVRHAAYLLEQAGYELNDVDKVLALTQGLPPSYSTFLITLDALDSPTFDTVVGKVLNEETRQKFSPPMDPSPSTDSSSSE